LTVSVRPSVDGRSGPFSINRPNIDEHPGPPLIHCGGNRRKERKKERKKRRANTRRGCEFAGRGKEISNDVVKEGRNKQNEKKTKKTKKKTKKQKTDHATIVSGSLPSASPLAVPELALSRGKYQ
jgi:hypothetical protein